MDLSKRTGVAMVATRCVMQLHGSVSFVVIVIVVIRLVVVSVVFKLVIVIIDQTWFCLCSSVFLALFTLTL